MPQKQSTITVNNDFTSTSEDIKTNDSYQNALKSLMTPEFQQYCPKYNEILSKYSINETHSFPPVTREKFTEYWSCFGLYTPIKDGKICLLEGSLAPITRDTFRDKNIRYLEISPVQYESLLRINVDSIEELYITDTMSSSSNLILEQLPAFTKLRKLVLNVKCEIIKEIGRHLEQNSSARMSRLFS